MATVATNPIINGLSGMLGKTIVFKTFRNKTIVASYSKPKKKQSERQKENRGKFRNASHWAKIRLKDPAQKAYYQKKAKKLGLPNAYTAAITDYMRNPQVEKISENGKAAFNVKKKDFALVKTEVSFTTPGGGSEVRTFNANELGECMASINETDLLQVTRWRVTDATGKAIEIPMEGDL